MNIPQPFEPYFGFLDPFLSRLLPEVILLFVILGSIWLTRKKASISFTSFLKKNALLIILILSAALRLYVYQSFQLVPVIPRADLLLLYQALNENFWEFIDYNHTQMPLSYLLYLPLLNFYGYEAVHGLKLIEAQTFILSVLAILTTYKSILIITKNVAVAALVSLLYSSTIVFFELWRDGHHLDHHAVIFLSYFIFSFLYFCQKQNLTRLILFSFCGVLLSLQSTTGFIVILVSVFSLLLFSPEFSSSWVSAIRKSLAITIPSLALSLSLSAKNQKQIGHFSTTSLGGVNLLLATWDTLGGTNGGTQSIQNEIQNRSLPNWWKWCFNNPSQSAYPHLNRIYGLCYPQKKTMKGCWPSDYKPLVKKLKEFGDDQMVALAEKDLFNSCNKKYLFAGGTPNLSSQWSGAFGKVSGSFSLQLAKEQPIKFTLGALRRHSRLFASHGPGFLKYVVSHEAGAINIFKDRKVLLYLQPRLFAFAMQTGYVFGLVLALMFLYKTARKRSLLRSEKTTMIFAVAAITFTLAAIFNLVSCCENPRYFMRIAPLVIILYAVFVDWAQKKMESKFSSLI